MSSLQPANAFPLVAHLAQPTPAPGGTAQGESSFLDQYGSQILVAVVTAIVVLFFSEAIKAAGRKLAGVAGRWLSALGLGFRKRYLRALAEEHRWLKLIGIYHPSDLYPPRLKEVYVSLRLTAAGDGSEEAGAGLAEDRRFGWDQMLTGSKSRVVVLGQPGAGKTTLLDYLVLVLTGEAPHPLRQRLGEPLPLFARLRELGEPGRPDSLLRLLEVSAGVDRVPAGFFERRLEKGGCVVLLDGLDEVLDAARHRRAVEEIRKLAREFPDNHYIVTCRVAGWEGQLPGFDVYEIRELDDDGIRRFVGGWYREVLRRQGMGLLERDAGSEELRRIEEQTFAAAVERAAELWAALEKNPGLLRIARTPLLLSLITLVHHCRVTDLPKGRANLYEDCLEVLLELWERQDKTFRPPEGSPSANDKRRVLEELAFQYLEEGRIDLDRREVERRVAAWVPEFAAPVPAADLVAQIVQRSGILVEQRLGHYAFAHRALHDYLAARRVVERQLDDVLLTHAAEERWREVILIAVGLAPPQRARALLEALLEGSGASDAALAMAGWSLAEDVQVGEDLRQRVRRRLLDRLAEAGEPAVFARLGDALRAADPEAARSWMREALTGGDPARRQRVLGWLPELGPAEAAPLIPLLLQLVADDAVDETSRAAAARALGGLEIEADGEVWRVLAAVRQGSSYVLKEAATWAWCELGRYEELGLVRVPAGEFVMGSEAGFSYEKPRHTLYLPTFYIGRYPVTVREFRGYVEASGVGPGKENALKGREDHPVVWMSWNEALALARWHGMALPSEAEWEKAARGTDGRMYPWGDDWRTGLANSVEYWGSVRGWVGRLRFRRNSLGGTTPVGYFSPDGDSPYGCADMAGNVLEWTRSAFEPYPYDPVDGRERPELRKGASRVLRGGVFGTESSRVRCFVRDGNDPDARYDFIGFRVVVSPHSSLISDASGF